MEIMLLLISILGSACSGLFGAIIYQKHMQNLLKGDPKFLDMFLGNSTTGALMIALFGAAGFWLSTAALNEFLLIADPSQVETGNLRTSDVQSEIIDAFPLEDAQ